MWIPANSLTEVQWRPLLVVQQTKSKKSKQNKQELDSYFNQTTLDYEFILNDPDGQQLLLFALEYLRQSYMFFDESLGLCKWVKVKHTVSKSPG